MNSPPSEYIELLETLVHPSHYRNSHSFQLHLNTTASLQLTTTSHSTTTDHFHHPSAALNFTQPIVTGNTYLNENTPYSGITG